MRNRVPGVPRYNEFRRLLGMKAPTTFDELTPNPDWPRELRDGYEGDIESVDLMVGDYANGCRRVSRSVIRLFEFHSHGVAWPQKDRFFPSECRPARSPGKACNGWRTTPLFVVLRHFPELSRSLEKWRMVSTPGTPLVAGDIEADDE
jgi:hypothetical protein